ncbi:von Willebrand domain-containing protein [Histoplasma capsulatum var. duboisii H88]|uniref:von Willebrand domain-containing protein n=1 Tax=Ajellomyces capsulatus (strain H88) TaxID=544711 RepID=F0UPB0_AJEC8|nr:von Willebrand domain-containing protein [Histoplasma capsulatum var. duboisii H88]
MPRHGSLQPLCGCWYLATTTRQYIPQVDLKAHSTILSASSRTILTQTFINPTSRDLGDVKYTFPLHDGVSIVGFKCEIDNRVIRGIVKERGKAKIEYQQAVQKGQAAALLEQSTLASDTFTTSIGKFPVGSKAVVEIIYLGELQHDAQSDGVRFSIPSIICPRYANSSVDTHELSQSLATLVQRGAINITVDVSVDKGSSIRGLQSPSHPIAITLGRTSVAAQDVFEANLASATLTMQQGNLFFDEDFVLIVNAKDQDVPSAFVETHPTIPNQRAIMATLVPKFNIPNNNPEIVFIIDRSGSMGGKIQTLQTALRVFLKSLPVGVKFNICSFGSSHSFMWKKSQAYDASSLKAALKYVDSVSANLGGTEILAPVRATVERRLKDLDLDILLLSDGEIWDQNTLFSYINKAVSDQPIRLFSLGIGSGASQSLIEGIARAGDGFAQFVNDNELLDKKVVRMLKGALTPHIKDYTAELVYENGGEDDFEIIEKPNEVPAGENFRSPAKRPAETMNVDSKKDVPKSMQPISLFDPSYQEPDIKATATPLEADLPKVQPPNVLQAPYKIPSLYPFNRTTVYFLLSPDAPRTNLKSFVLRGTSKHGPLMLKIPLENIGQGTRLHQLAARKITLELEEGRGWIYHAKNEKGQLIIDEHESKRENIVKREAVRLGIGFQVAGKYCSFVAVESPADGKIAERKAKRESASEAGKPPGFGPGDIRDPADDTDESEEEIIDSECESTVSSSNIHVLSTPSHFGKVSFSPPGSFASEAPLPPPPPYSLASFPPAPPASNTLSLRSSAPNSNPRGSGFGGSSVSGGFGSAFSTTSSSPTALPFGAPSQPISRFSFGPTPTAAAHTAPSPFAAHHSEPLFGSASAPQGPAAASLFGKRAKSASVVPDKMLERGERLGGRVDKGNDLTEQATTDSHRKSKKASRAPPGARLIQRFLKTDSGPTAPSQDAVHALIALQSFEGSWQWESNVFAVMELNAADIESKLDWAAILGKRTGIDTKNVKQRSIVATLIVLAYLNKKHLDEKETWELVGEKAMGWAVEGIKEIGGNADGGSDVLLRQFDALL